MFWKTIVLIVIIPNPKIYILIIIRQTFSASCNRRHPLYYFALNNPAVMQDCWCFRYGMVQCVNISTIMDDTRNYLLLKSGEIDYNDK